MALESPALMGAFAALPSSTMELQNPHSPYADTNRSHGQLYN